MVWTAAIFGGTGLVGQGLVRALCDDDRFVLKAIGGRDGQAGQQYNKVVVWQYPEPIPVAAATLEIVPYDPSHYAGIDMIFSALPGDIAAQTEDLFYQKGFHIYSNASYARMIPNQPLILPHVNGSHLGDYCYEGMGIIVTTPNCTTTGLCTVLDSVRHLGIESVVVTTMQAISGAGYPGTPGMSIMSNVLPCISGEEDKVETESRRLCGTYVVDRPNRHTAMALNDWNITATCTRVPVLNGHTLSISIKFKEGGVSGTKDRICTTVQEAMRSYKGDQKCPPISLWPPQAKAQPLIVLDHPDRPQPALDAPSNYGMSVTVGQIRPCPVNHVKLVAVVHNTQLGAIGTTISNAILHQHYHKTK